MTPSLATRLGAEAAGTALLVGIGTGAVVATTGVGAGRFDLLTVAWFLAVTIPVFLFAGISGAHLNPVVTLALAADRRIPGPEVAPHVLAQFAGAFAASSLVELTLGTGSHLGATVPAGSDLLRVFADEFAFTFVLVVSVLALVRWGVGPGRWRLLWPGLVVGASTFLIGPFTGSSLNPARSIAPAVLSGTFTDLWVYLLAQPIAALVAVAAVRLAEVRQRPAPLLPASTASDSSPSAEGV